MKFKAPSVPYFYYIADQIPIVPEHIWSTIANPVTYADSNPVGTGAYIVKPVHAAEHHLRGQPALLAEGPAQDRQGAVPGVHLQRPGQHLPGHRPGAVGQPVHPEHQRGLHLEVPGQPLLVRADRQRVAHPQPDGARAEQRRWSGRRSPTRSTGTRSPTSASTARSRARTRTTSPLPTFNSWLDTAGQAKYNYGYNPAKAESLLQQAGYTKGSDGIYAKGGQKLAFTVINIGGYSDWVASMSVIQQSSRRSASA